MHVERHISFPLILYDNPYLRDMWPDCSLSNLNVDHYGDRMCLHTPWQQTPQLNKLLSEKHHCSLWAWIRAPVCVSGSGTLCWKVIAELASNLLRKITDSGVSIDLVVARVGFI